MNKRQQGYSMVAMVMALLSISMLSLSAVHQRLNSGMSSLVTEQYYFLAYNQAMSSLNWGLHQSWSVFDQQWHCQQQLKYQLVSCIKLVKSQQKIIIKGQMTWIAADNVYFDTC